MAHVTKQVPAAHLLLVGKCNDAACLQAIVERISILGLQKHISILGEREDVSNLLPSCDIGVLSSSSEGLPMSLLEYGAAGLPSVATEVGQCSDVLDHGEAGILVKPGAPGKLAQALISAPAVARTATGASRTFSPACERRIQLGKGSRQGLQHLRHCPRKAFTQSFFSG